MGNLTIKRIFIGMMVLVLSMMIAGCGKPEVATTMQIQASTLTESESQIVGLIQTIGRSSQIFDYSADSNLKSASITCYELDDKGKWTVKSGPTSFIFQETSGRIAISFGDMVEGLRVAIEQGDGLTASESQPGQTSYVSGMGSSTSFADFEKIQYDKEIPLAMQVYSSNDEFSSGEVDTFYQPEKLLEGGYDKVFAITIEFSKEDLN